MGGLHLSGACQGVRAKTHVCPHAFGHAEEGLVPRCAKPSRLASPWGRRPRARAAAAATPECRPGSRFDKSQTKPLRRHNGTQRYQRGGRRRNKSRTRSSPSPLSVAQPRCAHLSFSLLLADTVSELGGLALRQPGTADGILLAAAPACSALAGAILERSCHDAERGGTPPHRATACPCRQATRRAVASRPVAGCRLSRFLGSGWATWATGMRRNDGWPGMPAQNLHFHGENLRFQVSKKLKIAKFSFYYLELLCLAL